MNFNNYSTEQLFAISDALWYVIQEVDSMNSPHDIRMFLRKLDLDVMEINRSMAFKEMESEENNLFKEF